MPTEIKSSRRSQVVAVVVGSLFVFGFFLSQVGAWTGPILGAWFVGTQKPRRGFLWMLAFSLIPTLIFGWRNFALAEPQQVLEYLGWTLLAAVLGVLPFTFHRLTSPRLPGFFSTLPLPLAVVAIPALSFALRPGLIDESGLRAFLIFWLAAIVVWLWNRESRAAIVVFGAGFVLVAGLDFSRAVLPQWLLPNAVFGAMCLGGVLLMSLWALFRPAKQRSWAERSENVALLQSPVTGSPLRVAVEEGREVLVGRDGERFLIRDGIPTFLRPEDLAGDNGKYNHLYETIGGFYDDTQRVFAAFRGLEIDSYFENYMSLLDVKAGDSVLETSVGTGLNFKYLPRGAKLSGLDLSPEMLSNCQANLRRWKLDADLYLGNAESLPFADASFDVVYTAGGFNFFSDRAQAIREMIRVVRPGGQLMIEDETEEYVKSTYENIPFTSGFYANRKQAVAVPIDLVPPEMQDIHLDMLKDGKFYAITFRKPPAA
jgi:ubiquinone/menaquinone biosynthesis C-methylase UbiE